MAQAAKNKIGLWPATSFVVGNMIGAGIFLVPAAMASFGSVSLLGWVFASIGTFFIARVFSNLSLLLPGVTGGPYAYTRHGFGDFAGFLVAWGYWLSNICTISAIAIAFVGAMSTFFPVLASSAIAAVITGLSSIWFLTWINNLGIKISGRVQVISTVAKLVPLLLISVGGLFFIKLQNFYPFNSSGGSVLNAISSSAAITMFSFLGIECATIPADSVLNPGKTVSRATMLGLFITTVVYLMGAVSIMGIIPAKILQRSVTPYADAAVIMFGSSARYWASAGAAIACFGALNGWTLVQGQMPYAIAKDKLFPGVFSWVNKKGAPYMAVIISSAFSSLFMLMNYSKGLVEQFKFLLLLTTLNTVVPYIFCAGAFIVIRMKRARLKDKGRVAAIFVGLLAFLYSLWAVGGTGQEIVYWGFLLLMAGIPFYIWASYKKPAEPKESASAE
jgi:basic amino acid/polyamine antiporter, APA family